MNKSLALKNKLSLYFLFLISFFILLYLFYFLINGERGIISYYKIKNQNYNYSEVLNKLNHKIMVYLNNIKRLQTNTLRFRFFR